MTSDESDTPGGANGDGGGQPRDPDTGKFLPKNERPTDGPEFAPNVDDETAPAGSEPFDGENGTDAPARNRPASMPETTGESHTAGRSPAPDPSATPTARTGDTPEVPARSRFVPDPGGYLRSSTAYLPALPWLRVPAKPPAYPTVVVPHHR